jgi:hypothetical protein
LAAQPAFTLATIFAETPNTQDIDAVSRRTRMTIGKSGANFAAALSYRCDRYRTVSSGDEVAMQVATSDSAVSQGGQFHCVGS